MSTRAMNWALNQRVEPGPNSVLRALAWRADSDGWCFAGLSILEQDTALPERTIRRHINTLESAGLVSRVRRHRKNGSRAANGYQLNILGAVLQDTVSGSLQDTVADSLEDTTSGSLPAKSDTNLQDTTSSRPNLQDTMSSRTSPSGQNGGGLQDTMSSPTSFETSVESNSVEEASRSNPPHTRESGRGSSSSSNGQRKAKPEPEPDADDDARIAAVDEMGVEVDKRAAAIDDFLKRKRFIASTRQLVSGDDYTAWADATGTQVPWPERPRLFRIAIDKLESGERPDLRRALLLTIQQQYDPFRRRKAEDHTPPAGSEAAAVAARGIETPRSSTPRQSSKPVRMGDVPVDLDADRAKIEAWERANPAKCRNLKANAEAMVDADPKTADLTGAIRNVAVDGRYRMLVRELLAAEKPVAASG